MRALHGWTLVETLIITAIIATLSGISVPHLEKWSQKHQNNATQQAFQHLVSYARNAAINRTQIVTLCPSEEGKTCSDDWSQPILIFTDRNHNEAIDPDDILLYTAKLPTQQCVEWRGSSHKSHLQFKPSGAMNGVAGHFKFCSEAESKINKKIVVALTGRTSQKEL